MYAVPLTENSDGIFETYLNSPPPDDSATNLEQALVYAKSLFTNPESGKIVVLTDGIETDGNAMNAVASLAMDGITVDFADYSEEQTDNEVQPIQVNLTDDVISVGENNQIELTVQSTSKTDALITFYDNGEEVESGYIELVEGSNSLFFTHSFDTAGLHELRFEVEGVDDTLTQNNIFYSYVYIDVADNILILQRENEAQKIQQLFEDKFNVTVMNISDAPTSLDRLRDYDQIILMNIANADMPEGFAEILNDYVNDIGGGLLTVGGTKTENGEPVANVYNREDMEGSLYQDMLPVLAEDYTPPIAVILVIDISGSMSSVGSSGKTLMEEAKESAKEGLRALDTRDYVGIVTFGDNANTVLDLTPVSEMRKIETAIDKIDYEMAGTVYSNGLERAGMLLKAMAGGVNKKHIIFISDGEPTPGDYMYLEKTETNRAAGITTSCISYVGSVSVMESIADAGGGKNYSAKDGQALAEAIKADIGAPEIREFEYVTFQPEFGDYSSILAGINENEIPTLDGFYGAKLKSDAQSILVGEYNQPIYAEWKYGNGKVGSFMCDLNGYWSEAFIDDTVGQQILLNIVSSLFPNESVAVDEIELTVKRDNYTVSTNIYTSVEEGETIRLIVRKAENGSYDKTVLQTINVDNFNGNQTVCFDITKGGIYEIEAQKLDADENVVASNLAYTEFSYSKEYDPFLKQEDNKAFIAGLAETGGGNRISEAAEVFADLVKSFYRTFDPRGIFAITVIVSLLLDVAVRKFKFKWPHEIIREKKQKKLEGLSAKNRLDRTDSKEL